MEKQTITMTFICRDDADIITPMLVSSMPVVDQVVAVDTGSKDNTKQVIETICAQHGKPCTILDFEWCDDFSAARNHGFQYIWENKLGDWIFWLDTDDEVENPDGVLRLFNTVVAQSPQCRCIQLLYHYAFDQNGNCVIEHYRERFLKNHRRWVWRDRVHEWLEHQDDDNIIAVADEAIRHRRQEIGHSGARPGGRNLEILERMVRNNPQEPRTWVYLGHERLVGGDIPGAIEAYQQYIPLSTWVEEKGQVLCRLGDLEMERGNFGQAEAYYLQSLAAFPEWPDGYYRLAQLCLLQNKPERCLLWLDKGAMQPKPQTQLILNPRDYDVVPNLLRSRALSAIGRKREALDALMAAANKSPKEDFRGEIDTLLRDVDLEERTEDFVRLSETLGNPLSVDNLYKMLPRGIAAQRAAQHAYVEKAVLPLLGTVKPKSITFFTGGLPVPWSPRTLDQGLGGTESAVAFVADELAQRGWSVTVFGEPGADTGLIGGGGKPPVLYLPASELRENWPTEYFVSVRVPEVIPTQRTAKRALWFHDVALGNRLKPEHIDATDAFFFVSDWQKDAYETNYGIRRNAFTIKNGLDLNGVQRAIETHDEAKDLNRFIWPSSPDRGLPFLLDLWPAIRAINPNATLDIYYGWDLYDLFGQPQDYKNFIMSRVEELPGVTWRGKVGKSQMYHEMLGAGYWMYPSEFCVLPGSEVKTLMGPKPIEAVTEGELVLTHKGRYRHVKETMTRPYKGTVYQIQSKKTGSKSGWLTAEHPVLIQRAKGRYWVNAEDVQVGDNIVCPVDTTEAQVFPLSICDTLKDDGFDRCIADADGMVHLLTAKGGGTKSAPVPDSVVVDADFVRFCGLYLAKGHAALASGQTVFTFSGADETHLAEWVAAFAQARFGVNTSVVHYPADNTVCAVVHSGIVARFLKAQFGNSAKRKHLAWWMPKMTKALQVHLLKALFEGVGHYNVSVGSGTLMYFTVSETLGYQLFDMLLRFGVIASNARFDGKGGRMERGVSFQASANPELVAALGYTPNNADTCNNTTQGWFQDGAAVLPVGRIKTTEYNGPVHNMEVEDDNSYVVGHMAVHNCETSCIVALECLACGVQPIVNSNAALPETLNGHGTIVYGSPHRRETLEAFLAAYANDWKQPAEEKISAKMKASAYALENNWSAVTDRLEAALETIER